MTEDPSKYTFQISIESTSIGDFYVKWQNGKEIKRWATHQREPFSLKEHIEGSVYFQYYKSGELWYKTSETNFLFPVPISDTGDGKFLNEDKAIIFMRYIRKYLDDLL